MFCSVLVGGDSGGVCVCVCPLHNSFSFKSVNLLSFNLESAYAAKHCKGTDGTRFVGPFSICVRHTHAQNARSCLHFNGSELVAAQLELLQVLAHDEVWQGLQAPAMKQYT